MPTPIQPGDIQISVHENPNESKNKDVSENPFTRVNIENEVRNLNEQPKQQVKIEKSTGGVPLFGEHSTNLPGQSNVRPVDIGSVRPGDDNDCADSFKKLCATYCCASSTDRAHVMRARCGLFNVGVAGLFAVGGGLAMKYALPTEPYAGAVGALAGLALYAAVACCQTILQGCRERPGGVCLPLNFRDGCPWDARLVIQRP